jgi:diguanylate cyclase (GGDEF)-like protein
MIQANVLLITNNSDGVPALRHNFSGTAYRITGPVRFCEVEQILKGSAIPDLLIIETDLEDGVEASLAGRAFQDRWHLPVILLAEAVVPALLDAFNNLALEACLSKPVNQWELLAAVELALERGWRNRWLETALDLHACLDLPTLLQRMVEIISGLVSFDACSIHLVENHNGRLVLASGPVQSQSAAARFDQETAISHIIATGQPLVITNRSAGGSWLGLPLQYAGALEGVILLESLHDHGYHPLQVRRLKSLAEQAGLALHNTLRYDQARKQSIIDPLTGAYNRRYFFDQLYLEAERARRYGSRFSLIMFDMDRFKDINDLHGHQAGDTVLQTVTDRCRQVIREVDVLGRYGGEEFVILLPETILVDAQAIAERLRLSISGRPIEIKTNRLFVSASLGIAEFGLNCKDLDTLVYRADRALQTAKENGKNLVASWRCLPDQANIQCTGACEYGCQPLPLQFQAEINSYQQIR